MDESSPPAPQPPVELPRRLRLALGILDIAGGAGGLLMLAWTAFSEPLGLGTAFIFGVAGLGYLFAVMCGIGALRRLDKWLELNTLLWALQVPLVSSPLLSYLFCVGAFLSPGINFSQPSFGVQFFLGSRFELSLLIERPWILGVNVLALGVLIYLLRFRKKRRA